MPSCTANSGLYCHVKQADRNASILGSKVVIFSYEKLYFLWWRNTSWIRSNASHYERKIWATITSPRIYADFLPIFWPRAFTFYPYAFGLTKSSEMSWLFRKFFTHHIRSKLSQNFIKLCMSNPATQTETKQTNYRPRFPNSKWFREHVFHHREVGNRRSWNAPVAMILPKLLD